MKGKKLPVLVGVICLTVIIAAIPFMAACQQEAPTPTPTPSPTPTPAPTPTPTPPAPDEEVWELMGESAWSAGMVSMNSMHVHHVDLIDKYTGGRVKLDLHYAPELVGAMEILGTVKDGGLDFGIGCPCYAKGMCYGCSLFCDTPGGQSPREELCWYYLGGGKELLEDLWGSSTGTHPLASCQNTSEVWLYGNKIINTIEDLKGLKMRAAGTRCDILNYIGGAAVTMAGGEIVPNLEKGVIDACEFASQYCTQEIGLTQVTKYCYYHPYKSTSSFWLMSINEDVWNSFPDDIKAAIDDATRDNHLWSLSQGYILELKTLKIAAEEDGAQFVYLPPAVIKEFDQGAREFLRAKAEEDASTAAVLDSWDAFKADYGPYAKWLDASDMSNWFGLWEDDVSSWYEPVVWPEPK